MYYITINVQYVRYSTGRKIKYFIVLFYRLSILCGAAKNSLRGTDMLIVIHRFTDLVMKILLFLHSLLITVGLILIH
jgi:hypothetical protein